MDSNRGPIDYKSACLKSISHGHLNNPCPISLIIKVNKLLTPGQSNK